MQNVVQHGTSLEIVQQDVILKCGDLDQHDIGTCETKALRQKVLQLLRQMQKEDLVVAKFCYFYVVTKWTHAKILVLEVGMCVHE
jgi:hypothetical protein